MLILKYDLENYDIDTCQQIVANIEQTLEKQGSTETFVAIPNSFTLEYLDTKEDKATKIKREWNI